MPPIIDISKCSRCGTCVDVCSEDVFFGSKKVEVPTLTFPKECWHCAACIIDCPEEAVKLRIPLPMMICYK